MRSSRCVRASRPSRTVATTAGRGVDSDGVVDEPLTIDMRIEKTGTDLHFDMSGSSPPCAGPMNSVIATTRSSVYLAMKHIFPEVPINAGTFAPLHIADPDGTFLYARYPRPVSGCAAEVSQRIAEAVFNALTPAIPSQLFGAPAGTSGNFALGGHDPRRDRAYVMYVISGGGLRRIAGRGRDLERVFHHRHLEVDPGGGLRAALSGAVRGVRAARRVGRRGRATRRVRTELPRAPAARDGQGVVRDGPRPHRSPRRARWRGRRCERGDRHPRRRPLPPATSIEGSGARAEARRHGGGAHPRRRGIRRRHQALAGFGRTGRAARGTTRWRRRGSGSGFVCLEGRETWTTKPPQPCGRKRERHWVKTDREGMLRLGTRETPWMEKLEAAAASVGSAVQTAPRKASDAANAAVERVVAGSGKTLQTVAPLSDWLASTSQGLLASRLSDDLNGLLANMAKGSATIYDKAMDAEYLATSIGGGNHRLFDGGHTILGAFKACRDASPDDTVVQETMGFLQGIFRDVTTPKGLPLATWDKAGYDQAAGFLKSNFGIPKDWFYDLNSYDAAELLGGTIGILSTALSWNRTDTETFSKLVGSMGLPAVRGANPLLLVVTVVALARAFPQGPSRRRLHRSGGRRTQGRSRNRRDTRSDIADRGIGRPGGPGVARRGLRGRSRPQGDGEGERRANQPVRGRAGDRDGSGNSHDGQQTRAKRRSHRRSRMRAGDGNRAEAVRHRLADLTPANQSPKPSPPTLATAVRYIGVDSLPEVGGRCSTTRSMTVRSIRWSSMSSNASWTAMTEAIATHLHCCERDHLRHPYRITSPTREPRRLRPTPRGGTASPPMTCLHPGRRSRGAPLPPRNDPCSPRSAPARRRSSAPELL